MKKSLTKTVVVLATLGAVACSGGQPAKDVFSLPSTQEGDVLVTVNGTEIRDGFIKTVEMINPRYKGQFDNPLKRRQFLEQIVDQQLLYQAAVDEGLHNDPTVAARLAFFNQQIIAHSLLEKKLGDAMKAEYEKTKDTEFTKKAVAQIAFYAIPEEDFRKGTKPTAEQKKKALERAKAAKARLDKGEDFAKLAKEISDDKRTAPRGGDAGQVARDDKRMARLGLKDVANKAFDLKKGEVSEPIEAPEGYYIIKVTSDPIVTPYAEAERVLGFRMQQEVRKQIMDDLKKNAKIEWAKKDDGKDAKTQAPGITVKPGTPSKPQTTPHAHDNHDHPHDDSKDH